MIDEVVVTALGIKREEKALGYAVQKVGGSKLSTVKPVNIATSLTGKVAGLNVTNSTEFNTAPTLKLRGETPLLVVDGVPYSNISLNDIAADDIESVDVLKGATASALYGARGGSGAIMVTTKKGSQEGLNISVNSSTNTTFSWKVGTANWDNGRTLSATSIDGKSLVVVGNFTLADKNFSVTFQETGTWYELLKDNEPLSVSSTTQTIAVPAHEFRLFTNFKPTLTGIETTAPDAEKPLIYYNRGMDTLVLPAGEAKRVEVYSVNGMLVMTQEKCTSVGLSALPVGYYMARAYMEDGKVQVCKIMK